MYILKVYKNSIPLVNLIHFMLTNRKVSSTLGSSTTGRKVNTGTSQAGVNSSFLRVTVVNDRLKFMESHGYNIIANADDVAIIVQGKYPHRLHDLMEYALTILSKYAEKCGLGVHSAKQNFTAIYEET